MFEACLHKQEVMRAQFERCETLEARYQKIIDLGRELGKLAPEWKQEKHLVHGCQSQMYLHSWMEGGRIYFEAESDAIISSGLAVLLISVYNGETPETVLKCPPHFIDELGIPASLTPGRANGLASLYLHMKQDALRSLLARS